MIKGKKAKRIAAPLIEAARGGRRRSSGIRARLVRKPRRIVRPGPVKGAWPQQDGGRRARRLRGSPPPHSTPNPIPIWRPLRCERSMGRALKTPTARRQSAPRGQNKIEKTSAKRQISRRLGRSIPRPLFETPPAHWIRPAPNPFRPRLGQCGSPGRGRPAAHRSGTCSGYPCFGGWGAQRAPHSVAPTAKGEESGRNCAPQVAQPRRPALARPPPHPTGSHGQHSLKAQGRALAPIDRTT